MIDRTFHAMLRLARSEAGWMNARRCLYLSPEGWATRTPIYDAAAWLRGDIGGMTVDRDQLPMGFALLIEPGGRVESIFCDRERIEMEGSGDVAGDVMVLGGGDREIHANRRRHHE